MYTMTGGAAAGGVQFTSEGDQDGGQQEGG